MSADSAAWTGSWVAGSTVLGWRSVSPKMTAAGWSESLIDVSMVVDWGSSTISWTYVGLTTALLADGATGFDFEIGTTGGNQR